MPDEAQPGAVEAQPQEGQGTEGTDQDLYSAILEGVPDEFHPQLTERLKQKDADFTKRFQERSEQVKPYEEAGVFDADPENLQSWMNLSSVLEAAVGGDDEAKQTAYQWWESVGDQLGFYEGDKEGTGEEEAQDLLDFTPDKLQELVSEEITKATSPLLERFDQQEQEKVLEEARQGISESLSKLRAENPNLTEDDEKDILVLAYQYGQDEEDPIGAGFAEFKRLVSRGESNLFEEKMNQPSPAEGGGPPNTQAPISTSENAKDLALERLRQMQAT